jgi:hypothetical protein
MSASYLTFNEYPSPTGKTTIASINSRRSGELLGEIRWHGPWRQYCFFPEKRTIWNRGCMFEIQVQITHMTNRRNLISDPDTA